MGGGTLKIVTSRRTSLKSSTAKTQANKFLHPHYKPQVLLVRLLKLWNLIAWQRFDKKLHLQPSEEDYSVLVPKIF